MVALFMIIAVVLLAAFAQSFGVDSRDYEPHGFLGDH